MADEYDGRVVIDTELDNSGFEKGSDKLIQSMRGVEQRINGVGDTAAKAFTADRAAKLRVEPELPEPEELQAEIEQIEKELPPVRPRLDSKEYDKTTERLQAKTRRLMAEINRMANTTAQGFKSTSSVIAFNNKLDDTAEKIVQARQELEEFGEQQIMTDEYKQAAAQIEKTQQALFKLYDRKDRMSKTGAAKSGEDWQSIKAQIMVTKQALAEYMATADRLKEAGKDSGGLWSRTQALIRSTKKELDGYEKQLKDAKSKGSDESVAWIRLKAQIADTEKELERYEAAADRMRETGEAFVDPQATAEYQRMAAEIERAQRALEANAALVRGERIDEAQLAVQAAQTALAEAATNRERRQATKELAAARAELEAAANIGMPATAAPDPGVWQRFGTTVRDALSGAAERAHNFNMGVAKMATSVAGAVKKTVSGFKRIATAATRFLGKAFHFDDATKAVNGLTKKLTGIKGMLVSRVKSTFIGFLFEQIKQSFNELAKFDNRFDQSVSNLRNRTSELGANVMAAFGGLIRQIEPYITGLIEKMSASVTKINAVLTALRGEDTMQVAVRRTESYADSLRETAKSADKARASQQKLNETLTSIDEIHKLDAPKEETQIDTDAGADAEKVVYENVPVESILGKMGDFGRKIADQIVQGIRSGDWRAAGTVISEGLNSVVQKIDDGIWRARDKVLQKAHDIAELLNGMVDGFDARALGTTIGDGINLALDTAYAFLETFDWSKFGQRTVEGLNGLVDRLDPRKIGQTIGSTLNAAIDYAYEIFTGFEWDKAGAKLAQSLNEFVKKVDWGKAAKTISAAISGLINSAASFLENADWKEIGQAIVDFFKNIDYASIVSAIVRFIGAAIGSIAALMKAIFEALIDTGEKWGEKLFEKYGDEFDAAGGSIWQGVLAGLKAAIKDVASWCKKNIVDPFVKGFKKAFGISSPSKEMKPYGGYVGEGVLEGIAGIFSDITNWIKTNIVEPFKRGFSTAFSVVGDKANALFENGKSIANGIKGGITAGWSAISTLIKGKKDDLKKDSEELADSAVSGFSDTSKFTKAGQKVVDGVSAGLSSSNLQDAGGNIMDSLGRGINDSYDEKVGRIVTQRTKQIGDTLLDPGVADFEWAGKTIDERVGDGIWDAYDVYIRSDVTKRAAQIADDFRYNADYYGAGAYAAEMFSAGVRENYATAIQQFEGIAPTEWTTAMLQAFYGVQQAEKSWNDTNIRTVDSLRTIKTVAAEAAAEAENLNGKEVQISVDGAASVLDKVADKLAGIARTFDAIGKAFSDMTTLPVPAVAMGAIAPAQTRVTDDSRNDGITATLIERLIGRIEELEEAVANRPIRVESKVMIDQREIGRATADYNANNNRVTNGNGGASW